VRRKKCSLSQSGVSTPPPGGYRRGGLPRRGNDCPRGQPCATDEHLIWPFLQVLVAADEDDLEAWDLRDLATDRRQRPKGVVEVHPLATTEPTQLLIDLPYSLVRAGQAPSTRYL
jgi:hypothetical protein